MIQVRPSVFDGAVDAPPSKSFTHRALLIAALTEESRVEAPLMSADTRATMDAVRALGATTTEEDGAVVVRGGELRPPADPIDCHNSGTTLRLLTAAAALPAGRAVLTGDESLRKRPMAPLLSALTDLGAHAASLEAEGCAPVEVRGPLRGGVARIRGDVSSQFVSALLIAGTQADRDVVVKLESPLKSRPYVDITVEMVEAFSGFVATLPDDAGFLVPGAQSLKGRAYRVPGDFSSAAFPLAAAAVTGGSATVANLDPGSPQGDKAFLDHLEAFGASVAWRGDAVTVTGEGALEAVTADLSDTPDLFPVLCAVAAHADGESRFTGASHLRFKESDRISAMVTALRALGVEAEEREDGAVVRGGAVSGGRVASHGDHRILMASVVAGLAAEGAVAVEDAGSHVVSYPGFVDDFQAAGCDVREASGE